MVAATKAAKPDIGFHVKDLRGLSRGAKNYLRRHPEEARKTVADALEAAATDKPETFQVESHGKIIELPLALKPRFRVVTYGPEILSSAQAAERLGVSEKTVQDWFEKKILIGWKQKQRWLVIPEEQILASGEVMPGIKQVIEVFRGDASFAWVFLKDKWSFGNENVRPIDKLKEGKIKEVLGAALNFFEADFS